MLRHNSLSSGSVEVAKPVAIEREDSVLYSDNLI